MSATRTVGGDETWDERRYRLWEECQEQRYELVDGRPRSTVDGTRAHDRIGANLRALLWEQLRRGDCLPYGPDLKVRAGRNIRYPDAFIDCGKQDAGDVIVQTPFAVLSKSTAFVDQSLKLRDYDATASIEVYGLISQDDFRALVYRRDEGGHFSSASMTLLDRLDSLVEIPEIGVSIILGALYERVLTDAPNLVPPTV